MKQSLLIAWKDYKSFFTGATAYVVGGLFALISSYMYAPMLVIFSERSMGMSMQGGQNMTIEQTVFPHAMGNTMVLLVFLVPPVMMRLMSDEYRNRTMDLLLTSPVTSTHIIVGKYLAGVAFIWTVIGVVGFNLAVTSLVASFDIGHASIAFLGLLLIGAVFAAACLFASSLTESSIIAGFLGLMLSLFIWLIGFIAGLFEDQNVQNVVMNLSVRPHFDEFTKGVINSQSVIYYFSLIFFFCFLSHRVVESARWR